MSQIGTSSVYDTTTARADYRSTLQELKESGPSQYTGEDCWSGAKQVPSTWRIHWGIGITANHMDQGTRNQDGNITIFARMERVLEIGENKWKSTREWKRSLKEGCTSSQKNMIITRTENSHMASKWLRRGPHLFWKGFVRLELGQFSTYEIVF